MDRKQFRRIQVMTSIRRPHQSSTRRGGALLSVLWLSAALSAIAFTVATRVRGETDRASTLAERTRAYYLAVGGVERAIVRIQSDLTRLPDHLMRFSFPGGETVVEVIPETARVSLNVGTREELTALLVALGAPPAQAAEIALAAIEWRSAQATLDEFYSRLTPSFRPRHASFLNEEEALFLKGMTPELFHGSYVRDASGRMVRLGALKDCVSVFGTTGRFDVNSAEPALLASLGMPRLAAEQIVALRSMKRIQDLNEVAALAGPAVQRLRVGGNSIYTLRATARIRRPDGMLSDLRHTVAAQVKFLPLELMPPHHVLRWRDWADSEVSQWR
jgi:general secretion pathway protein K